MDVALQICDTKACPDEAIISAVKIELVKVVERRLGDAGALTWSMEMATSRQNYLFVCYANENRSPAAEEVCRSIAQMHNLEIDASSAGISRGANRSLTKEVADKADKIFVMEEDMKMRLVQNYGQDADKIICLDIPDVYNRDDPVLIHILEGKLYEFLAGEGLL